MPGPRISDEQKRKFFYLVYDPEGPRIMPGLAAKELGFSKATAYRLTSGLHVHAGVNRPSQLQARLQADLPSPKRWDELSTDARAGLGDLNVFGEMFFCRRPSPWRKDAAMRLVDAITDRSQRTFLDMNVFPGSGKTTLLHDIKAWLICGGGTLDPAFGRALRIMIGSRVVRVAEHSCLRLRRSLELRRPYYDKEQRRQAEFVPAVEYGRFKPNTSAGEESIWAKDQFLVAQLEDVDLYEKEPTVQVASQESGFLGERVDLAVWDDIATYDNSRSPEQAESLSAWFEDEAETRVEPGGVLALVGQRLGPLDLHRNRLDAMVTEEDGIDRPKYTHIVYPAHQDDLCDETHDQWDPAGNRGCLTDAYRLPLKDWIDVRAKTNYRTVYQQEDSDPARILIHPVWLEGGTDHDGYPAPGCFDRDRGFFEWPERVGPLIDYCVVDPASGKQSARAGDSFWALEWWAVQPQTRHNYLIHGRRARIQAGDLLDWDNAQQEFKGWMHELQVGSILAGHPIRVWIIEAVAAHRYLFQFEHFRRWRQMFPMVSVIPHQTQRNKTDPDLGVDGLMPMRYKSGQKHLPRKRGVDSLNYIKAKVKELTTYPYAMYDDTVLADWMGEWNLDTVLQIGNRALDGPMTIEAQLSPYLKRQLTEKHLLTA